MIVSTFLIDQLLPCLLKHPLSKLLSQEPIFTSAKFYHFFLRVSGTARTVFFFFFIPSIVPAGKEHITCFSVLTFFNRLILFTLLWICFYTSHYILWIPPPFGTFKYPNMSFSIVYVCVCVYARTHTRHNLINFLFMGSEIAYDFLTWKTMLQIAFFCIYMFFIKCDIFKCKLEF